MKFFKKIIRKLFYLNAWNIGYRTINDDSLPINDVKIKYKLLPTTDSKYYADPFVFKYNNDIYLFAEYMNRYSGKGTIAVSKFENGKFSKFSEVLKEDFHLSYPNVFSYNGQIYMIPETSAAGQVRLYKSVDFPNKWSLEKILIDDEKPYVDTSLFFDEEGKIYLYLFWIENGEKQSKYCSFDMSTYQITEIDKENICVERPAGNPFLNDKNMLRAVQNCGEYYGKSMFVVDVDTETVIGEITDKNLILDPNVKKLTGMHTLNRIEGFEVIDIRYDRFCVSRPIIRIWHLMNKILGVL